MYRQYEDPRKLENQLKELEDEYNELKRLVWLGDESEEVLYDKYIELQELRDRVRFAWDDEENG